ncbi:hypothetical protein TNCV_131261 [Trichonephila clavipes]|nr:hypothetical protein TNCV_131261 [Trichonephila clavipes]
MILPSSLAKRKVAPPVIDASQNTTGLLNTLSEHLGSTLEGRFENGKLRVFPQTFLEHRKLQSYLRIKKLRSHTFGMADNKQLKAVIRGLPTDYDQKEIASELKGFGKQQKNQPNKNIWTVKAKKRTQKSTPRQQQPSYASTAAQNIPKHNTFDANSIMQQMGQMMAQWGTMIAFLQQNNKN